MRDTLELLCGGSFAIAFEIILLSSPLFFGGEVASRDWQSQPKDRLRAGKGD
jgi:hypothetical protein